MSFETLQIGGLVIIGFVVVALVGIILFQSVQNQKLVNKLMSRNYGEYITATRFKPEEPKRIDEEEEAVMDEATQAALRDMRL